MTAAKGILVDTTLCTGCAKCVDACKEANDLSSDIPRRWKQSIDDLSSTRFTTLVRREGDRFVRRLCRHCLEPACVSACIVGAMKKTADGPVIYDSSKCIGCRYCMLACPYGVPRYDWEAPVPYVRKCDMCYERIKEGTQPACVEACPQEAAVFGSRDDLIAEAHRRIQASPGKYVDEVVGETEVGGTSILFLSDVSLDFLGWKPDLGSTPLPDLTWAALSKVPALVVGVGGLMGGIWWITERRMRLARESAAGADGKEKKK